jgi:GTPase SAR1 family protein
VEQLDAAFSRFSDFVATVVPTYWDTLATEMDVRTKLIDRVFVDILGWPLGSIQLEDSDDAGRSDYRMSIDDRSRLMVEAKREGRDLGINDAHGGRFFKLNGTVFNTEASKQAIKQLIGYCAEEGAELACGTNGRQWFVFRGNRSDGTKVREGFAFVFGSLGAVKENFQCFYDLLAYESVVEYRYRAMFHEAEGQPVRARSFRQAVRPPESRLFLEADQLSRDLDRIMLSFFQDLRGQDDPEARRACFVTTSESDAAEQKLSRISEELRDRVQSLSTTDSSELTEVIKRAKEMQRHEMILLVGTKGAGKSTFVDRFFCDILARDVANDCILIRVDLSQSGGDTSSIVSWLDQHVLEAAETAAFQGRDSVTPTYEDLQGMFYGEYSRWKTGPHRHLYERDKSAFKEKFGEHVEQIRQSRPHEYILGLLGQIAGSWKKVPCLIFDNADHFDVPFQEAAFNYANSIYSRSMCLLILPITDTTSWQLPKQGPLQSFYAESFFLPTPATEHVLRRRIDFIELKVAEEKPERGKGYFLGRGIRLELENIKAFTACLQALFVSTGQVAEWIGRLANHDVRRCLQLTREIVSSPHINVADLLKAFVSKTTLDVSVDDIKLAIVRGKYDVYPVGTSAFVHNVFDLPPDSNSTPLLPIRVLEFLRGAWASNPDNDGRYVGVREIQNYFHEIEVEPRTTARCLDALLQTGLVLEYDPTARRIVPEGRVQVSPSGRQHLLWGQSDWVYLESLAETTALLDANVYERLKEATAVARADLRRDAIELFLTYLITEDGHFVTVPGHTAFEGQLKLIESLRQQLDALRKGPADGRIGRYARRSGRVSRWEQGRGFGIVDLTSPYSTALLHVRDVLSENSGSLPVGAIVEVDLDESGERLKAYNAIEMKSV